METVLEVLRGVRELLSVPEKWTKNVTARDAHGAPVNASGEGAVCFCLYGAVQFCIYGNDRQVLDTRLFTSTCNVFSRVPITRGLPSWWQDRKDTTHAMLLEMIDEAIALEAAKKGK